MAKKIVKYSGTKTLEILEGADKYNSWIAEQFIMNIDGEVLEFGAGIGNISQFVHKRVKLTISDIDKDLLSRLKNNYSKNKNTKVIYFDITKNPPKKYLNKFDAIYSSNVLEHIREDEKVLKNLKKILRKNGKIAILVPAKQFAFTKLDKRLGHHRRYEKEKLRQLLKDTGYEVDKIYYFNIVGLPAWKIRDYVTRNNELNSGQVKLFDSIVPFLKIVESLLHPPIGISLVAIARKK